MRDGLHVVIGFLSLFLLVLLCKTVYTWHAPQAGMVQEEAGRRDRPAAAKVAPSQVPLAPLFTEEVRYWAPFILRWAREYDLDPNLVATVMQIESCGYVRARSHAGAMGLFQVMPYHFAEGEDPYDPETNARRGLTYLKKAWERTEGDVRLALAAYNGGFRRLQEPEDWWPEETRRYVRWGTGIYQDAREGRTSSPTLEEWLAQGGWWLCQKARLSLPME